MHMLRNERGIGKIGVLLILAALVLGFMNGIKYLDVQLDHQSMKDAIQAKAAAAQVFKDHEIQMDLEAKAIERGLPMKRDHFLITRDEEKRRMIIKTGWTTEVTYLWGVCGEPCKQRYSFEIVADEAYATR